MNTTLARVIVAVVIVGLVVGVPTLIWLWDRRTGGVRAAAWDADPERAGAAADTPTADSPAADSPAADSPAADSPAADSPAADSPAADTSTAHSPPARVARGTPERQQTPG